MPETTVAPRVSEFETEVVVESVEAAATDVALLTLTPVQGQFPVWAPGAHVDLVIDGDVAGEIVRQYSLCGDPDDRDRYQVAVLRALESRGGSLAVHGLSAGSKLRLRGPRNHFPMSAGQRYLFIAGGIGITPILPMVAAAEAAGAEWELHYGGRSLASMAFRDLLAAYGDRVRLVPQDTDGLLDLETLLGTPRPGTHVYCCGPEPLLAAVEEACASWPTGSLHLERFTPREHDTSEDTAFDVVLERSGLTLRVEPGVTVFDTMRAAGVSVLGSCLEGTCGTCEQTVLEGEVDHRDEVLDDDEKAAHDCMMVCVSRAVSPTLVLDA